MCFLCSSLALFVCLFYFFCFFFGHPLFMTLLFTDLRISNRITPDDRELFLTDEEQQQQHPHVFLTSWSRLIRSLYFRFLHHHHHLFSLFLSLQMYLGLFSQKRRKTEISTLRSAREVCVVRNCRIRLFSSH